MKKGFVCGAFDLLHAGHVHLLKKCKEQCDVLVVGLHIDPSTEREFKHKPIESMLERQIRLKGCRYVDQVITYETEADILKIFKYLNIDVRFTGSDHNDDSAYPIPTIHIDSLDIHSSEIRERIKNGN